MAQEPETALATKPKTQDITAQAQLVFDVLLGQREKMAKLREKRQNALMENARYDVLRKSAQDIVREAFVITHQFDLQHPKYKVAVDKMAKEMRESTQKLNEIAMVAFRTGVGLELFQGKGKNQRRVYLTMHVQPKLV